MSFTSMHNEYLTDKSLDDFTPDNTEIKQAFSDYESLYDLYRSIYRYGACGANVGAYIMFYDEPDDPEGYPVEQYKWVYGDDLRELGTFKTMDEMIILICALSVGSIVEGVEECTDTIEVKWDFECDDAEIIRKKFDSALEEVEQQAAAIWNQTHGCETCAKHWAINLETEAYSPIWLDCPDCKGEGEAI